MKTLALLAAALATAALAAPAMPPPTGPSLKGEVLEVRDAQPYTYLRLKTKDGEAWAAVPSAAVKKGAQVTLENTMVMENFESKTLKRKFDRIVFATLAGSSAAAAPHGTAPAPAMSQPQGKAPASAMSQPHGTAPVPAAPVAKVARATGPDAKSVAEVVTAAAALKGKSVTIRGQVVKFNAGILGKNWVHLQDGSGSAASGTHDILVTTMDATAVGEVIVASGTVRKDVNVGSGYVYAVLVEDAKLRK